MHYGTKIKTGARLEDKLQRENTPNFLCRIQAVPIDTELYSTIAKCISYLHHEGVLDN